MPLTFPMLSGNQVVGLVDVVTGTAFKADGSKTDLVGDAADHLELYQHELNEAVAETSEELMEKFFMEEPFTADERLLPPLGRAEFGVTDAGHDVDLCIAGEERGERLREGLCAEGTVAHFPAAERLLVGEDALPPREGETARDALRPLAERFREGQTTERTLLRRRADDFREGFRGCHRS